jgi:hypothetical protein
MPIVIGNIDSTVVIEDAAISSQTRHGTTDQQSTSHSASPLPTVRESLEKLMKIRFQARSAATDWR